MINKNDLVRDQILRYFYERNDGATSRFGKRGSAVRISDVKRDLKTFHNLSQQQVVSNLTYLLDRKRVNAVEQEKTFATPRGTAIPSVVTFYEISADGIDRIEVKSTFQSPSRFAGINISASGSNVITLGDGNIVQAKFEGLFDNLRALQEAVATSDLGDDQKLDAAIDIATLQDQLAKSEPDAHIIERVWQRIGRLADVSSLALFVTAVAPEVLRLIGS